MIPKVIHYCWFGGNPLPKFEEKCLRSWKKYCPDYKIIEWNETNFDINCNQYLKEAYEAKKWAFVTDYVRLSVLYNYGGIYMDTDVELLKPIDNFLNHKAFLGFESEEYLATSIMATEKGNDLYKFLLSHYEDRHFVKDDGTPDTTTNVFVVTQMLEGMGLVRNGTKQDISGLIVYPKDYFCPKEFYTDKIKKTKNTVCIHHFDSSWLDEKGKEYKKNEKKRIQREKRENIKLMPNKVLMKILGKAKYDKLKRLLK